MKKICVITDNEYLFGALRFIISKPLYREYQFDFFYSFRNEVFREKYKDDDVFCPINLKEVDDEFYEQYDLFVSLHCKQLFPDKLVNGYRCVNIHPGYNPYNRGWFPQVFSIMNKKPVGVTIHEMDNELDHGPIIFQEYVEVKQYDTSWDVYNRIQKKEVEMLERYLLSIIENRYVKTDVTGEGNVNNIADFERLCHIDLNKTATYGEVLDFLRAMTFSKYDNAYFIDDEGEKIYVSINMKRGGKSKNGKEN